MNRLLFAILFLMGSSLASAATLSPEAQLKRMSLLLRGQVPISSEYEQVKGLSAKALRKKLSEVSLDYMNTRAFNEKMRYRLLELFRLQIPPVDPTVRTEDVNWTDMDIKAIYDGEKINRANSLDTLFFRIAANNLDWNLLLTAKEYEVVNRIEGIKEDPDNRDDHGELGFFKALFADQINDDTADGVLTIPPDQDDQATLPAHKVTPIKAGSENQRLSVAGAVTTKRFFRRYTTTMINKNRRRAAQVFRIFLCDEMRPVVLPNDKEDDALLDLALFSEENTDVAPTAGALKPQEKRHGDESQCQSCHYKLDPTGETFMGSGMVLNPYPAPGALVFKNSRGKMVNVPVRGIGELGEAITSHPDAKYDYLECQVQHFWNWFIGSDVPLHDEKKQTLALQFEQLERKPKDFIRLLIEQPEFGETPLGPEEIPTLSHVKPILKQCDQCHTNEPVPQFYKFPIGDNVFGTHEEWIESLVKELDLENDGENATMPKKSQTNWRLTNSQTQLLKRWIVGGARDEKGAPSITQDQVDKMLKNQKVVRLPIEPSFMGTYKRYFEYHDLFRYLHKNLYSPFRLLEKCSQFEFAYTGTRQLFGLSNPVTGIPNFKTPSPSFNKKVYECVIEGVRHMDLINYKESLQIWPQAFLESEPLRGAPWRSETTPKSSRQESGVELYRQLVDQIYGETIGHGVYSLDKEAQIKSNIINFVDSEQSLRGPQYKFTYYEAARQILVAILTSEEFLSF